MKLLSVPGIFVLISCLAACGGPAFTIGDFAVDGGSGTDADIVMHIDPPATDGSDAMAIATPDAGTQDALPEAAEPDALVSPDSSDSGSIIPPGNDSGMTASDAGGMTTPDTGVTPPPPICSDGETECTSGTTEAICTPEGQWGPATACTYVCSGNACGGVCTPGTTDCSGSSVRTCSTAGEWVVTTTCTGGMSCSMSTSTATCVCPTDETNCSGTCVDVANGTPGVGGLGPTNCGSCGHDCAVGASCTVGICTG
jgi:hypothetical protein